MERRIAVRVRLVRIGPGVDQQRDGVAMVRAYAHELLQRRQSGGVQPFRIGAARQECVNNIGPPEVRPEGGMKGRVPGAVLAVSAKAGDGASTASVPSTATRQTIGNRGFMACSGVSLDGARATRRCRVSNGFQY